MVKFGAMDLLSHFITLIAYYFMDLGSDFFLFYKFCFWGRLLDFSTIIVITVLSMYSANAIGYFWENREFGITRGSYFFYILPLGLFYQKLRILALLLPLVFFNSNVSGYNTQHLILRENWKAVILALVQVFASNTFLVLFQIHLMVSKMISNDEATVNNTIISIISCSLAVTDYHVARRRVLKTEKRTQHSFLVIILTQFSTLFTLAPRFIAFGAITASDFYFVFIVIISIHWILLLIAMAKTDFNLFHQVKIIKNGDESENIETEYLSERKYCIYLGSFIFSLFLLISHLEAKHKKKMILIHFLENLIFLLCWFFTLKKFDHYDQHFLLGVPIVLNIIGLILCFIVWGVFLKRNNTTDQESDTTIQAIPQLELTATE